MSHPWKTRAIVGVLCLSIFASGCYGPFNMTRRVHHWNGTVSENEWAQEGVYLLLNIIPVYGIAVFLDSLIFNSIEFWGGENPVSPPTAALPVEDNGPLLGSIVPEDRDL